MSCFEECSLLQELPLHPHVAEQPVCHPMWLPAQNCYNSKLDKRQKQFAKHYRYTKTKRIFFTPGVRLVR